MRAPRKSTKARDLIPTNHSAIAKRGFENDFHVFEMWCISKNRIALPATPVTVAQFIGDQAIYEKVSTVRQQLCAIAFAHSKAGVTLSISARQIQTALRFSEVSTAFSMAFPNKPTKETK